LGFKGTLWEEIFGFDRIFGQSPGLAAEREWKCAAFGSEGSADEGVLHRRILKRPQG
jgi:hypothetical protein